MNWGLYIAICALITGTGKFLDDFHINTEQKSKAREWVKKMLAYVERPKVPNFPKIALERTLLLLKSTKARLIILLFILLILPFILIYTLYLSRKYYGIPFNDGFYNYLISWFDLSDNLSAIGWAFFLIWAISFCLLNGLLVINVLDRWNNAKSNIYQLIVISISVFTLLLVLIIHILLFSFVLTILGNPVNGYGIDNLSFSINYTLICISPWAIILIYLLFMFLLKSILTTQKIILSSVLKGAALPEKSPFIYFSTLISVMALLIKVVDEIIKIK
ncbi:hypothetical protein [Larkinella terrae]|uniref:Uncharacterized protein n=1 Tax=Larkinella terrae TaxID=2025311 RepID=A0A7K0EJ51_9BACT|nr:hypothetical protein [Larkinella terrae]MRS61890.1 hypothetical protein [Larkinella terrae]